MEYTKFKISLMCELSAVMVISLFWCYGFSQTPDMDSIYNLWRKDDHGCTDRAEIIDKIGTDFERSKYSLRKAKRLLGKPNTDTIENDLRRISYVIGYECDDSKVHDLEIIYFKKKKFDSIGGWVVG